MPLILIHIELEKRNKNAQLIPIVQPLPFFEFPWTLQYKQSYTDIPSRVA